MDKCMGLLDPVLRGGGAGSGGGSGGIKGAELAFVLLQHDAPA